MSKTIKDMWEEYKQDALVFTTGEFAYTVGDIKDDFYAGAAAVLTLMKESPGFAVRDTLELRQELEEYWSPTDG